MEKHFDETTIGKLFVTAGHLAVATVFGTAGFAAAFILGGVTGGICETCGADRATALNVAWFVCGMLTPLIAMPIGAKLTRSLSLLWK